MSDINNITMSNGESPLLIMYNEAYTKTTPALTDYYKYANDAGGYYVHGIWLAPSYSSGSPYWWPWDLSVPSGALKDKNDGWRYWGYINDGTNKNLTSGMNKSFPANGYTFYGVCLCFYYNTSNFTDTEGRACLDFGDNPVIITFKDGRFDNFEWLSKNDGSVYEWSEDKRTITIYRVGTSRVVCYIKYEDDTSINRVRQLLTDVYADVSNLTIHSTTKVEKDPSSVECWNVYQGNELIYHKDKTVENCISKYFGSVSDNGTITIPDSTDGSLIKLPNVSELTDLQDYDTTTLKFSGSANEVSGQYVDWINQGYEKNLLDTTSDLATMIGAGKYGCLKCNNTEDSPVKIYVPLGTDGETFGWEAADFLTFDNALGGSDVNYLQIIFKDRGLTNKCKISTTMRSFQKLKVKNLDFIHEEADGTVVTPYEEKWGFMPIQLRAAFEGSNITVFKKDWMSWERVTMMPYCFDMCSELTEIQCNGETATFFPHNVSTSDGQGDGELKWPYFKSSNNTWVENWDASYAFWRCEKLKKVGPVFDVHWWHNPGMYKYMFKNANNIEYLKLKGLNNMDWDFTSEDLYLPKLGWESIMYMLARLEDQIGTPYTQSNVDTSNVDSTNYPDIYFDHKNIRSSRSTSGLKITVPDEWRGFCFSTNHGWTVYSDFGCTKVDNKNITLTTRYLETESALRGAICGVNVNNFKFKVTGLASGDKLVVSDIGNVSLQSNVFTTDGEYVISTIGSNFGFALHNADNTITSAVTITLDSCAEFPNFVEDDTILWANKNGWKVCESTGNEIIVNEPSITIPTTNGLYIYDTDGKFTSPSSWNTANNSKAVGVALIDDNCKFVIAKEDISTSPDTFGGDYGDKYIEFDSFAPSNSTDAKKYYGGYKDTLYLISYYMGVDVNGKVNTAAWDCYNYIFPNGKRGYLGSSGEWYTIYDYGNSTLNNALTKIGGKAMTEDKYWTSTKVGTLGGMYRLIFKSGSLGSGSYGSSYYTRAFLKL